MKTNAAIVQEFREKSRKLITHDGLCVLLDYPPHESVLDEKSVEDFWLTHLNAKDALIEKARQEGRDEAVKAVKRMIQTARNPYMVLTTEERFFDDLDAARTSEIPPNEDTK